MTGLASPRVRRIVGIVIMLASLSVVIWAIVGDDDAPDILRSVQPGVMAALVALQASSLIPQAYRYKLTVDEAAQQKVPARAWFEIFVVGRFLNALFPQAGNAYRGLRLKEDYSISVTKYLSGFLAFTWLSTLLNLAVALVLIVSLEPDLQVGEISAWVLVATLLALSGIAPPALLWVIRKLRIERGLWGWAYRRTEDMLGGAVRVMRSRATMWRFTLAGLAGLGIAIAIFSISFDALALDASVTTIVLFFVLLQLSTYLNITPGNLGVLELGFGALASQLGIGLTSGLLVATLIRLSGYAALLVAGLSLGGLGAARRTREPQSDR